MKGGLDYDSNMLTMHASEERVSKIIKSIHPNQGKEDISRKGFVLDTYNSSREVKIYPISPTWPISHAPRSAMKTTSTYFWKKIPRQIFIFLPSTP